MMRAREIMKAKGITLRQVAERLGITSASVSQQLNGNPSYKTMEQLALVLGVPMWQLLISREELMEDENLRPAEGVEASDNEHSADGLYCPVCGTELKLKLVKADE